MTRRVTRPRAIVLDERVDFTLGELSASCGVRTELVIEMVDEGVLQPQGRAPGEWRFSGAALVRAHKALRLHRDLQVNWPGAALALDLLDELERTRRATMLASGRSRLRRSDID